MKDYSVVSVRIPGKIYKKLKGLASQNFRSLNQQINLYLERSIEEQESKEKVTSE